ncbi:MAG TPA: MFS transporter [Rhodopila sp.]|uniref:MFS transporter n=1 Tax=Rhodopila sp. TaxID=2480087 RepID=UPI002BDFDE76|nr:MFS transporter [Rhodopila sp.]HVY18377.1 MFS transporter [Rhodopila sp.]
MDTLTRAPVPTGPVGAADHGLQGNPRLGLVMGTWGFFIGFAAVALYGPAAHAFQQSMQLSPLLVGLLVAAPQLTGSLLRIPFGAWVDQVGGRLPMLVLFGISIVGMWGLVFILVTVPHITATLYPVVLLFGFMSGCGVASFSVGIPQVSYWFPRDRQGTALGIYGGVGNLAPGLFTLLLPFAISALGLAGSYLAWLAFLLIGTGIYGWLARDAYYFQLRARGTTADEAKTIAQSHGQELFPRDSVWGALLMAADETRTWGLTFLYFVSFGGFLALTTWFPTYWINFHHLSLTNAGILGGVGFSLLAAVARVGGGSLAEKFGGEVMALLSFAIVLVGAALLTFATSFPVNIAGELLIGLGMGLGNAAVFKMVPKYVPHAVGGASGIVGGLGALGGFVIPPTLGLFAGALGDAGYSGGFFVYVVLAVAAMLVSIGFIRNSAAAA